LILNLARKLVGKSLETLERTCCSRGRQRKKKGKYQGRKKTAEITWDNIRSLHLMNRRIKKSVPQKRGENRKKRGNSRGGGNHPCKGGEKSKEQWVVASIRETCWQGKGKPGISRGGIKLWAGGKKKKGRASKGGKEKGEKLAKRKGK